MDVELCRLQHLIWECSSIQILVSKRTEILCNIIFDIEIIE